MALSTATVDESTFVEESELSVVRHGCRGCWPGWPGYSRYRLTRCAKYFLTFTGGDRRRRRRAVEPD